MIPTYLTWHLKERPGMIAQDVVKLVFQAHCGCGHLLAEEVSVLASIEKEESLLLPDAATPLTEPLGDHYCRLNLRRAMADGITPLWIARMMKLSAKPTDILADRKSVHELLVSLNETEVGLSHEGLLSMANRLLDNPDWLPGHSESYRQAYAPAYRVISRDMERLLPILTAYAQAIRNRPQVLICIDGPCGSGKTTLARQLAFITDAACVPMDDFYTPHPQKTPERMALPGGNADVERLLAELLIPWRETGHAAYRPYLCAEDRFGDPVDVPQRPLTILEGSYSLLPAIAALADVRVFLTVDEQEQLRRLLVREGAEGLKRFRRMWIPLEKAYHTAFSLPNEHCLIIEA